MNRIAGRSRARLRADLPLPAACNAQTSAFFLDIDGTLLDIAHHPDGVVTDAGVLRLVQALHAKAGGALALISGRTLADVDRLFGPVALPLAGQHGVERRDAAGRIHRHTATAEAMRRVRAVMDDWTHGCPDVLVEDKGLSIAFHYRQAPARAAALEAVLRELVATEPDLHLQTGKMVFEVKPAGRDKGLVIREFMAEPPFAGRLAVFVGDDATDEFGFAVVNAFGGVSVKVGGGETTACFRLPNVPAVQAWMREIAGATKEQA